MARVNRTKRVKRLRRMAAGVVAGTVALTGGTAAFAQAGTDGTEAVRTTTTSQATTVAAAQPSTTYSKWRWSDRTRTRTGTTTPAPTTPTTPATTTPTTTKPAPAPTPTPTETTTTPAAATADRVVNIAKGLQGKVQYGHTYDPTNLVMDCSGFTYYVFKQAGINLKTRDDDVQATMGTYVPQDQLQKGDLVFFWNSSSTSKSDVGHVGIYIGDGKYIHNANGNIDVVVSNVNTGWAGEHYITARRIIE